MQNCGIVLLLCWLGRKFEHKIALNLGEDPFLWYSPNFWPKAGLNLSGEFFLLVFIILKFPAPPPPFENPAYASVYSAKANLTISLLQNYCS